MSIMSMFYVMNGPVLYDKMWDSRRNHYYYGYYVDQNETPETH